MRRTESILVFPILMLCMASSIMAEPPARSIFQQAKVPGAEAETPKKELLLMQAIGLEGIQIPETYGRVMDVYQGAPGKTIIHIPLSPAFGVVIMSQLVKLFFLKNLKQFLLDWTMFFHH